MTKIYNFGGTGGPAGVVVGPLGVVEVRWGLKVANLGQNSHPSYSKTQNGQKSAVFGPLVAKICNFGGVPGYRWNRLIETVDLTP